MSQATQRRRSRRYFAHQKEEKAYLKWVRETQGLQETNLVEKLKLKKGGKLAREVHESWMMQECSNLEYWEMCP